MWCNPIQVIQTADIPWFREAFAHLRHSVIGVILQYPHCCWTIVDQKHFGLAPVYAAAAKINSVL